MASHKFKVGQSLVFSPRQIGNPGGNQSCKVVRLVPVEGGECQYRIKCTSDNVERIAKESQLWRQN
ncbi:MAG: hypothetical protein ACR2PA_07085 [Hyphomicrobiaceae bacterium]